MAEMKGTIVPYEVTVTRDNGDRSLGTCWIPQKDRGHKRTSALLLSTTNRDFIVPAQDGVLIDRIVDIINNASNELYMSSFLVQKSEVTDALIEASQRGVFIALLTARESDLSLSEDELDSLQARKAEAIASHKQLLDELAGNILIRTSSDFHAKYIIADPFSNPAGILMTSNATVDAMNGSNIELALTLLPDEVLSLFQQHIHGFWEMANYELLEKSKPGEPGRLNPVGKNTLQVEFGKVTTPATYGSETGLRDRIVELIRSAKEKIILCAWTFQTDYLIMAELASAIDKGRKVEIYARFSKENSKNTSALLPLLKKGATIYGHSRFHAKAIIVDGIFGLVMTANISDLGLDKGFEAGIDLGPGDAKVLGRILDQLKNECEFKLHDGMQVKDVNGKILLYSMSSGTVRETVVEKSMSVKLPERLFASCQEMLTYSPDVKEEKSVQDAPVVAKSIVYRQLLKPPMLPKDAKITENKEVPFSVYATGKGGKNTYIAVNTWEEVKKAQAYASKINAKIVLQNNEVKTNGQS